MYIIILTADLPIAASVLVKLHTFILFWYWWSGGWSGWCYWSLMNFLTKASLSKVWYSNIWCSLWICWRTCSLNISLAITISLFIVGWPCRYCFNRFIFYKIRSRRIKNVSIQLRKKLITHQVTRNLWFCCLLALSAYGRVKSSCIWIEVIS